MMIATGLSIHTAQGAQLQSLLGVTTFPAVCVLQPSGTSLHLVLKAQGLLQCNNSLVPLLAAVQQRIRRQHARERGHHLVLAANALGGRVGFSGHSGGAHNRHCNG